MSTGISPTSEQFIQDAVQSGAFSTREAVIDEAIRLMRDREEKRRQLVADVNAGIEQIERGEVVPLDAEDIKRRGRERLASRNKAE